MNDITNQNARSRRGFFQDARFITGITESSRFLDTDYPEIALIGRSNVGKSTMINLITDNKKMARVSKSPGCTKQINFFLIRDAFMLVDLPGYGYAVASKASIKGWKRLIERYFNTRKQLRQIMLLIDAKAGITASDMNMLNILREFGIITQIVMTKCDKLSLAELDLAKANILKIIDNEAFLRTNILLSSAKHTLKFDDIGSAIFDAVFPEIA